MYALVSTATSRQGAIQRLECALGRQQYPVVFAQEGGEAAHLASANPPAVWVLEAALLNSRIEMLAGQLEKRGLLGARAALMPTACGDVSLAWQAGRLGFELLVADDSLEKRVVSLLHTKRATFATAIQRLLHLDCVVSQRLLQLLTVGGDHLVASTSDLARTLGVSRTTLFARLASAGLPTPERCQLAYRLMISIEVLRSGGTQEDAAWRGRFADASGLRRGLGRHFGLTIAQTRAPVNEVVLAGAWLRRTEALASDAGTRAANSGASTRFHRSVISKGGVGPLQPLEWSLSQSRRS